MPLDDKIFLAAFLALRFLLLGLLRRRDDGAQGK
jgi:hypothetical protein